MSTEDMKHCPFCKVVDLSAGFQHESDTDEHVSCDNCGARGPLHGSHWNDRPIEEALHAQIKSLRAECDKAMAGQARLIHALSHTAFSRPTHPTDVASLVRTQGDEVMLNGDEPLTVRESLDCINDRLLSITEEIAKVARPPMRHHRPIPGPVRWIEQRAMGARSCMGGTALGVVSIRDEGMLCVLIADGYTRLVPLNLVCFPLDGPTNEPPKWAPEVATMGPVKS